MRIEIDLPDEMVNPALRARIRTLWDQAQATGEGVILRQIDNALDPPTCGAPWEYEPWGIDVACDLEPGHSGTHRHKLPATDGTARIRWRDAVGIAQAGSKPDPGWVPTVIVVDDPDLTCGHTWTHDDGSGAGAVEHTCTIYPHHDGDHIDGHAGRRDPA